MFKLLLVDDEKSICEGIARLLDWEEYGIRLVGSTGNGREALEMIRIFHPEIVLTDVRMPEMDGLELIETAGGEKDAPRFVILSGYDDYELVHRAMKLGVVDYLLKPVSAEALSQVLEELIANLSDEMVSRLHNQEHFELLKNTIMNRLITDTISGRELRSRLSLLEEDYELISCRVVILQPLVEAEEEKYEILFDIYKICVSKLQQKENIVFTDAAGRTVVLFTKLKDDFDTEKVMRLTQECLHEITEKSGVPCVYGMGGFCQTYRQIRNSYQEADKKINLQLQEAVTGQERYSIPVCKAMEYAEKNFSDRSLSLGMLADLMNVNSAYLGRSFKKECKVFFSDYLNSVRIEKAKQLLLETADKGTQIARAVGFENYNYFYITFKKLTGETPSGYRERNRV